MAWHASDGHTNPLSQNTSSFAHGRSDGFWWMGALASQLYSESSILGEFHWVGLHGAISRLAVAV
jgi:hypothetical protein